MYTKKNIENLAEDLKKCQKILEAMGGVNRQHMMVEMMKYIDFIDSECIREFNRKYDFSPAELAVLVMNSMHTTVEMKIEALCSLLDEYSTRLNDISHLSNNGSMYFDDDRKFQDELNKYVEKLQKAIDNKGRNWFKKPLYIASFMEIDFNEMYSYPWDNEVYFDSFDDAYMYLQKQKNEYMEDEDLRNVKTSARIKVVDLDSPERQYDMGLFMFNNELELCYIYLPGSEQDLRIDEIFYVHIPSPFKEGDIVKWNSPFYKPVYGVITHNALGREEDRALKYGEWSDVEELLDIYYPPEIISNIDSDNIISTPGFWGWDHLPFLELEKCELSDIPEELKTLSSWKKRQSRCVENI